jgi:hypothetical protein
MHTHDELGSVERTLRGRARRDILMLVAFVLGVAINVGAMNAAATVALAPEAEQVTAPLVAGSVPASRAI